MHEETDLEGSFFSDIKLRSLLVQRLVSVGYVYCVWFDLPLKCLCKVNKSSTVLTVALFHLDSSLPTSAMVPRSGCVGSVSLPALPCCGSGKTSAPLQSTGKAFPQGWL